MNNETRQMLLQILSELESTPSEVLESDVLEFKAYRDEKALHNAKELAEEISALANHKGGHVLVGVKDSSDVHHGKWYEQLVGIEIVDIDTTTERIHGRLEPAIPLAIDQLSYKGKNYLVIGVHKRPDTLVSTRSGKTCIRDGKSSRPMNSHEIRQAVKGLTSYDWTAEVINVDDFFNLLDEDALAEAMRDFIERRGIVGELSPERYLEAIGATRNGHLTNGGLLFLGKASEIRNYFGLLEYRFSWKEPNGELKLNEIWESCIWNSVAIAKRYFDHCNNTATFKSRDREFTVPMMDPIAFHEAYLNAIAHRDYSEEGMVSVNFTGKKLMVTSPGLFFGGVTAENIGRHEPRHRNKALAKILMDHKLVDRAGMGVMRMGIGSLKYGRGFPRFRETSDCVEVSLDAEYLRPAITVLALGNSNWGIPELIILNCIYERPAISITEIEKTLTKVVDDPWETIEGAVDDMEQVELCGTNEGVFVRAAPAWRSFLGVNKNIRVYSTNSKHVALYKYLKKHKKASNSDLSKLLGYSYSSQTSKFLREANYVKRTGSGVNAVWSLV